MKTFMKPRTIKKIIFVLFVAVALCVVIAPFRDLFKESSATDIYSHIPLIPIVSAVLFFLNRKDIFGTKDSLSAAGLAVMAAAAGLFLIGKGFAVGMNDLASVSALASVLFVAGAFLLLFGWEAFRKAAFPFAFLLWIVPLPAVIMDRVIAFLVIASTELTRFLFEVLGVPFVREGSVFHLPDLTIEIATQCSGIRSSFALLITTVLAAHLFLKKFGNKAILALAVFPVAVLKNAIRIVTLYLLSYYIDWGIIEGGFLHKSGGFIFFGLGLAILGAGLLALRSRERKGAGLPPSKGIISPHS